MGDIVIQQEIAPKAKFRKCLLTINNPEKYGITHEYIRDVLSSLNVDYYAICDEIGEKGTYHTHIFFYRESTVRFRTVKEKFPSAHIDIAQGSCEDNRNYLLKEGKWKNTNKSETSVEGTFEEHGEFPEYDDTKPITERVVDMIRDGCDDYDVLSAIPKSANQLKNFSLIRETLLTKKFLTEMRLGIEVTYLYGASGTGKTRSIFAKYDALSICRMTNYKSDRVLFDSYSVQDVLVFEEFHGQIPLPDMLNYLDIYPLKLPARYHDRVACYTKVYITSNISLDEQYPDEDIESVKALKRRIHNIVRFDADGTITVEKGSFELSKEVDDDSD